MYIMWESAGCPKSGPVFNIGTCESFFFVRIESRIGRPIRFRIESSNRIGRIYHASRNTTWRTAGVPYRPIICYRLALWTNES